MRRALAVMLVLAIAIPAVAAKRHILIGEVVTITDSDTITVLDDRKVAHKVRLAGIDAPEKGQPFETEARDALAAKLLRQAVRVEVINIDSEHREVGRLYFFSGKRFRDACRRTRPQFNERTGAADRVDVACAPCETVAAALWRSFRTSAGVSSCGSHDSSDSSSEHSSGEAG